MGLSSNTQGFDTEMGAVLPQNLEASLRRPISPRHNTGSVVVATQPQADSQDHELAGSEWGNADKTINRLCSMSSSVMVSRPQRTK